MNTGYGSVLIVRRQTRNTDGDLVGGGTDRIFAGWDIAPESSTEGDGGRGRGSPARTPTSTRLRAYGGPRVVDIEPGDRVYLSGDDRAADPRWHVVGEPESWGATSGDRRGGHVVTLQRVTG